MRRSTRLATISLVAATALPVLPAGASSHTTPRPTTVTIYRPATYSVVLADQLLAQLGYLPVRFAARPAPRPIGPPTTTTTTSATTTTTTTVPTNTTTSVTPAHRATPARRVLVRQLHPVPGRYLWRFPDLPTAFRSQWRVGTLNVVLQSALMRFQSDHGLATTGSMDTTTWQALQHARLSHAVNRQPYDMVYVSETLPETLHLYVNGHLVFTTLVNTGISVSQTELGTHPVYLRFLTQTMAGTNPNGTHYSDPGIPWVSYFYGGDALHGFLRASYGWPQSLGCVEMPFAQAHVLWPYTPIGTPVTVVS